MERNLGKIYYDLKNPYSYGSINNLYKEAKKKLKDLKSIDVKNWLEKRDIYSLNRKIYSNFERSKFISSKIDRFWSIDLVDISQYQRSNDNFRFLLMVVDILSKYGWVIPIKKKNRKSIILGFQKIFKTGRKPEVIISDAGGEFVNSDFKKYLFENDIKHYIMRNTEVKAANAERFNRTIKEKIFKYMNDKNTGKFIHKIPDFLTSYNSKEHSRTKMKPIEVNKQNQNIAFLNLYKRRSPNRKSYFKSGDIVRILKLKNHFSKGYNPRWTKEKFKIRKILSTLPFQRYILEDSKGNQLIGSFYNKEIIKC